MGLVTEGSAWWRCYARSHEPYKVLRERPLPGQEHGDAYLYRYRIFGCPLFSVYVHRIVRPDNAPELHDHPWPFWHLILEGGYVEEFYRGKTPDGSRSLVAIDKKPGRLAFHRAGYAHRIARLTSESGEAWTLVVVGPKVREWGFLDRLSGCWVHWKAYIDGERC